MKSLLIILTISLTIIHAADLKNDLEKLTKSQRDLIEQTYQTGKQYGLELTLVAILWEESQFGKYKLRLDSNPSCGIMHIMPRYLIKRTELSNTQWNRSRLCERLMLDDAFSLSAAILELQYWRNLKHGQILLMRI